MKKTLIASIFVVMVLVLSAVPALAVQEAPNMRNTSFADAVPNENDIIFDPAKKYTDFYLNKSGTMEDPIIIWGNGAKFRCILLDKSNYVVLRDIYSDGCNTFGIRSTGDHVQLINNTVTNSVLMNFNAVTGTCGSSASWHSGMRVADAVDIYVEGNTIDGSCGEALSGLRIDGAVFLNNVAKNGFSVNIYCDQCVRTRIERNTAISDNPKYYRDGKPARGILIGGEKYTGHGFTVGELDIIGNYLKGTRGINYYSEMPGFTPYDVFVSGNMFEGVLPPIVTLGSWAVVENNIIVTPGGTVVPPTMTVSRTPALPASPTFTPSPTASATLTKTVTPTTVPSATRTPIPPTATKTLTPTPFIIPTVCETAISDHFWFMGCTQP